MRVRCERVARRVAGLILLAAALVPAAPGTARAQAVTLDEVLRRMHAAVVEYEDDLAALVLEEEYEQRLENRDGTVVQRQVLRSHYLVFQLPPEEEWFACREVFEVNGEPVPGARDRLRELLAIDAPAIDLAYKIYDESARYNLGGVVRTFNLPTFALALFRPAHRRQLEFAKLGEEAVQGVPAWVISFKERDKPRFIATPDGKGLRVHGRVWVAPADGRLLRTELVVGGDRTVREEARVTVTFRFDPIVQLWVPDVMEERYEHLRGRAKSSVIIGRAVYSQGRRLPVKGKLSLEEPR
jgi:hypothetical protein